MMEWMSWTVPTAAFFIVIGLILVGMTVVAAVKNRLNGNDLAAECTGYRRESQS